MAAIDDNIWALVDPLAQIHRIQGAEEEVETLRKFVIALHGLTEGLAQILIDRGIVTRDQLIEASGAVIGRAMDAAQQRSEEEAAGKFRREFGTRETPA